MSQVSKIIQVGHDIELIPAVEPRPLIGEERLKFYPLIGRMIALAEITEIPKLRELCFELFPAISKGEINCICGGFSLVENGSRVLVTPQCCGDFSCVCDWEVLADLEHPQWSLPSRVGHEWNQLWFGHPILLAKQDGDCVLLVPHDEHYNDQEPPHPEKDAPILRVPVRALRRAFDEAAKLMETIELRLSEALATVIPDHLISAAIDVLLRLERMDYDELREKGGVR